MSKIVSKIISTTIHKLIGDNQSAFSLDRIITENILLAQEILHCIKGPNKNGNVVIKLDMKKTFDRMG